MKYLFILFFSKLFEVFSKIYWFVTYSRFRAVYSLDNSFQFNGKSILLYGVGEISAGSRSYIGGGSTLQAAKGYSISIGSACKISHNVRIYTQSAIADNDFSLNEISQKYGDVKIGSYCWIGVNVMINPGVLIGVNSVVGANSVVTKDNPPYEIWGGVPAKFIRIKSIKEPKFVGFESDKFETWLDVNDL